SFFVMSFMFSRCRRGARGTMDLATLQPAQISESAHAVLVWHERCVSVLESNVGHHRGGGLHPGHCAASRHAGVESGLLELDYNRQGVLPSAIRFACCGMYAPASIFVDNFIFIFDLIFLVKF